jgi:hypothetical protein
MKWVYNIRNKMAASAVLLFLCLLVLLSNYVDRDHTDSVRNSISTLYKDRLIAEDFIFKMSGDLYQIKEILKLPEEKYGGVADPKIDALVRDLNRIAGQYLKTEFTKVERVKFIELMTILETLKSSSESTASFKLDSADKAIHLLEELSAIQLQESKLIVDHADFLYRSGKASLEFAGAIVVILLLVLQALVFASTPLEIGSRSSLSNLN